MVYSKLTDEQGILLGAGPSEKKTSVFTLVYDLGFENFFLKKNVTSDQSEEDS
jgi:hypothetical protein